MVLKQPGKVGGRSRPIANKMIRTTFLSCKHGDDMTLFLLEAWMAQEAPQVTGNSDDNYEDYDPDPHDPCGC